MGKRKLNVKDLINIGLFTAVYTVCFFAVGMTGYIPIMMLFLPFMIGIVGGIPIMLLVTKVSKLGVFTLTGTLVSLFMFFTGHPWPILAIGIPFAVLADLVAAAGSYKKWPLVLAGYTFFSLWSMGAMYPLFFMRDSYFSMMEKGYGEAYANEIANLFSDNMLPIMIVTAIAGAIIGAYLGRSVLKKHFKRAGVA